MAKLFVPLIKINISTTFEAVFGKWILDGKSTGADLTKKWKFCTISKWGKKIFFGKIICSTHQKNNFYNIWGSFWKIEFLTASNVVEMFLLMSGFYNIWGSFWKIEFLTENRQARTLQNSENFVLSQNGVRKYFLAKLFVPLIKRNKQIMLPKNIFLHHFEIVQNFHYFVRSAPVNFLSKIQFSKNWKLTGADLTK